jgi:hypothetical protein
VSELSVLLPRINLVRLTVMGTEVYDRYGTNLVNHGLVIDHSLWQFNVFELRAN